MCIYCLLGTREVGRRNRGRKRIPPISSVSAWRKACIQLGSNWGNSLQPACDVRRTSSIHQTCFPRLCSFSREDQRGRFRLLQFLAYINSLGGRTDVFETAWRSVLCRRRRCPFDVWCLWNQLQLSTVQLKVVCVRPEKPICAPPRRVSQKFLATLPCETVPMFVRLTMTLVLSFQRRSWSPSSFYVSQMTQTTIRAQ